jgi:uncharacterized protein (DUF58 family)
MEMKYIKKVKANLSIYTRKKTSNILDGSYNSIYKGRSMNFEDLREYIVGDNIKDIDWKASARSNKILIKQYVAEKKHNILFILDTGKKMLADTKELESKKEIALMVTGTIAYLVNKNGDSISAIYKGKEGIKYYPFQTGLYNVERILNYYDKEINSENNIETLIDYVMKYIKRRMIIFIITDIDGISNISEQTLKRVSLKHDVMVINISDALMTGDNTFDIDQENYIPDYILEDENLKNIEIEVKNQIYEKAKEKFKKYNIMTTTINKQEDIVKDVYKLLERRKNANIR